MQTSQFIDLAVKRIVASLSRADILVYTNQVQNFILGRDCPVSRVQPDPYFTTVNAQYSYEASNYLYDSTERDPGSLVGDVRNVKRIYRLTSPNCVPDVWWPETGVDWPYFAAGETVFFGDWGQEYRANIGVIISKNPDSEDCVIKWPNTYNPHDSTKRWRAEVYKWPTQLLSESVALSIPDEEVLTLLLPGLMEYVEANEYGNGAFPSQQFIAKLQEFDEKYKIETLQATVQPAGRVPYRSC